TSIQKLLSRDNSVFRYFLYSSTNQFIDAFGKYWGDEGNNTKYNSDGLKEKIKNVKNDLERLASKKHQNSLFELYEIQHSPLTYSFYKIDNELYFVPSKVIKAKEIKPPVFHFKKTENSSSMYSKIEDELNKMID